MLKKSFCLLILLLMVMGASAQTCTLKLASGQTMTGTFVDATDTTITFLMDGAIQPLVIPVIRLRSGTLPHKGKISVQDGKIIIQTGEDIKAATQQQKQQAIDNPNYAIGKALKRSGTAAMVIGVPCFAAGLATCIAGHVGVTQWNALAKSNCIEASYYLLPIGASLTIVSIPLYVEGKKLMELKMNYTGNGVGVAMNF